MSIETEIARLKSAKAALKKSIEAHGVAVDDEATLDAYSAFVDAIGSGAVSQLATYGIENSMLVLTYSGDAADASLDVDAESGMLSVTVPDSYSGATFTLENGYLEVNTNG